MTLYRATAAGQVAMTAQEEADQLAEWAAVDAQSPVIATARVLSEARASRIDIFARLDGLQASNLTKALVDTASAETYKTLAAAIETAKQSLRDMTLLDLSAGVGYAGKKAIIMAAYKATAAALPASLRAAFAGLDQ